MTDFDDWLNELKVRGLAGTTIRAYQWQMAQMALWYPDQAVATLTRQQLTAYIAARRDGGWGDSSIKFSVCAMRSYYKFTLGKRRSPARTIPMPRPKLKPQRTLTADQAMAVLASCDTSTKRGQRDLALLCLMLDTGLRNAEVCRLRLADVNLTERSLEVVVKGGAVGVKRFGEYTAAQIRQWIDIRDRAALPGIETLFVHVKEGTPLTVSGMRVVFRAMARRSGLAKFSPHDLRRTFATLTIRNGAPTRMVQLAGGWNDLRLLERYTQALMLDDVEQYLPVGRLMGM